MVTAHTSPHSTRNRFSWQEGLAAACVLLLLALIFFWPQLVQGRALYWGDIGLYFTPMTQFLHDNLRQGRLPLWNPLMLCGAPYVGNPQTWTLYPLTVLLPWLSVPYFLSLTVALHIWLAGFGTYVFVRRTLGLRSRAALLGALTFMFGGWLVSKEQFPNMVQASAYLPWVLWGVDQVLMVGRVRDALALGLIVGLQLLAAHAQMTLLTLYLAAAWGLFRLFTLPQIWVRAGWGPRAGHLALAALVAFGLSAGQILPDMQMFHDGWRQHMSFHIVNRFYLPLNQSANWVLPTLHGDPLWGNFTARGNFWETCCYVGWISFALAIWGGVGAARRGGDPRLRFWLGAFVVAFLMALGGGVDSRPGPYWLAYHLLPGFRSFHDPARCLFWATFALAVLAATGLEQAVKRLRPPRVAVLLALLVAFVDLAHFGRMIYPLTNPHRLFPVTPAVAALQADPQIAAHQARFLAPDSARVWQRFSSHKDYREHTPGYLRFWADTLTPNLSMEYGLPDAYGYEPVTRKDAQTVLGKLNSAFAATAPAKQRARAAAMAGRVGVRFVVTDRIRPPEATLPGLRPLFSDPSLPPLQANAPPSRVCLSRNALWQPRARLVARLRPSAMMLRPARFVSDTPDRVVLNATAPRPAFLLLADTLAPGWQATVDGQRVPIQRAQGFLRAVRLTAAGRHQIIFSYRPVTFLLGLYLTLLTAASLLGAGIFHWAAIRGRNRVPAR